MNDADFLGQGWAFPVRNEGTKVLLSSDETNIRESIRIILETPLGQRVMRPDFGCALHELVFAPNNAATTGLASLYVKEALDKWEPRIEVSDVATTVPVGAPNELHINISYIVRETNVPQNMVYPFYLEN